MDYAKNLLMVWAIMSFSCTNASAMPTLVEQSLNHFSKRKGSYTVSKHFFSDKIPKKNISTHHKIKKADINKILETPIIAKQKPISYDLPKDFFIEDRDNVIVERLNKRILHFHQNITLEEESFFKCVTKQGDSTE